MFAEFELRRYRDASGRVPFTEWFEGLDSAIKARVRVRLSRLGLGHFGDAKTVGDGVVELRMHFGPGYRVYCVRDGQVVIVLLGGGDKSSQTGDIRAAREAAAEYRGQK